MVKGNLAFALDGKGISTDGPPRSCLEEDGRWTVTHSGRNYVNVFRISEFDDAGRRWLVNHSGESPDIGDTA